MLAGVRWAEAVILLLGVRYGDRQPSGISPTHVVGHGLDLGPVEPGRAGAEHRGPDGAAADAEALGDRPVAAPQGELLPQDLSGMSFAYFLAPNGGVPTSSIFQIVPARLTTYAVFPMKSSDVGRSSSSTMTVNVRSALT